LENNAVGEIRLISPLGKTLKSYPLAVNSTSLDIDCTDFTNGIYFYSLIVNGRMVSTKKLLITK
jgi:hypothetical protein